MKKIWYAVVNGKFRTYDSQQCINKLNNAPSGSITDSGSFTVDGDIQGLKLETESDVDQYLQTALQKSETQTEHA
jgi:hypothetical protein